MPEVSVIIPNYNHEQYLAQRIESVLQQTFTDFEIIILDDRSTDNSKKIIERYRHHPKVANIVYNTQNSGSTFKQWEKGLLLATGRWVWIAESDDYSAPSFLAVLMKLATENEQVGIAFCNSHWIDDKENIGGDLSIYKESFFRKGTDEVKNGLAVHCTIQNASSCIMSRELALRSIHGLNQYKACGDWIFYTRLLQHANLVYTQEKLNYFRWYHANVSSKAKEKLWVTEGIDVVRNIDFDLVPFSRPEFFALIKHWGRKLRPAKFRYNVNAWTVIIDAMSRYFL